MSSEPRLSTSIRAVAFYLPQFHPIPQNDEWWGRGFTEWHNVAKARPLFWGHRQPHLPQDLGFYDLRVPETRQAQADLAARYGVQAFCYWHYWFAGQVVLGRPLEEVVRSGAPNHPFCVAWANQTWSGTWHGLANRRTLIEQTYPGADDDKAHFEYLLPAFRDPRYLTVDKRPIFYIFCPHLLPDPEAFSRRWRAMARAAGFADLYLIGEISELTGNGPAARAPEHYGFDAGVYVRLPARLDPWGRLRARIMRKFGLPELYDYSAEPVPVYPYVTSKTVFPCVYPNWDHTPRNRRGVVLAGANPGRFSVHLRRAVEDLLPRPPEQRLLFIKSWNEWAEGNYLEPDMEFGHGFLQALTDSIGGR